MGLGFGTGRGREHRLPRGPTKIPALACRPAHPTARTRKVGSVEDPLAYSRIGLVGSGEFTPAMADIDREILATIGPSPRVVILPTASAGENPEEWATWGVGHFLRLGARSIALMVLERSTAGERETVEQSERPAPLYIPGGKPARLLEALEGSPLWN